MGRRGLALLLLLVILSGCWSRTELNDLGVVLGIGVDVGEDEAVRLTLYIPRPVPPAQKEGGGMQGDQAWVVAREAANLTDAMALIRMASARRIVLYHLRAVVIGEEYARTKGVGDLLDMLATNQEVRMTTRVFVAKGRAQEVLETLPQLRSLQPNNLVGIIQARGGVDWKLKDILVARASETHSSWTYSVIVRSRPAGTPGSPTTAVTINGAALFVGDFLMRLLDAYDSQLLNWFVGTPTNMVITTTCPDPDQGSLSVRIDRGKVRIRPSLNGNKVSFNVDVRARVNLERSECGEISGTSDADRRLLEVELEEDLRRRFERFIAILQETGADPVGFGKWMQLAYPDYFRSLEGAWGKVWPKASVRVNTQMTITRFGLTTNSATRTEQALNQAE